MLPLLPLDAKTVTLNFFRKQNSVLRRFLPIFPLLPLGAKTFHLQKRTGGVLLSMLIFKTAW
jgi:hypothetical protein